MIALFDSGGKDCRLAYELAGLDIDYSVAFTYNGKIVNHGTEPKEGQYVIELEGENVVAMVKGFLKAIQDLELTEIIVGIINPVPMLHRVCRRTGCKLNAPLLKMDRKQVIQELLNRNIVATIISGQFQGEIIDQEFINNRPDIDICGELGEYHTNAG